MHTIFFVLVFDIAVAKRICVCVCVRERKKKKTGCAQYVRINSH